MSVSDIFHNSRDAFYRFPGGARACGETVCLRVRAPKGAVCQARLWEKDRPVLIPMRQVSASEAASYFETEVLLPPEPDVIWYAFLVEYGGKRVWYGNAQDGLGGEGAVYEGEGSSFQITVYDLGFHVPSWMPDAVMYQIFPDRFFMGGESLLGKRGKIIAHQSWEGSPLPISKNGPWEDYPYDFFGGNLKGVEEKLSYLKSLGISVIYFNPLFKACSNHKYDTGDYHTIDETFGTNEDFARLCQKAKEMGIRVMLDGVFSHTGDDSIYFNRYGHYEGVGAYQSEGSPYRGWYTFNDRLIKGYACWWDVETLPELNKDDETLRLFFLGGENAVVKKWLRLGASGWRLDVADELPDDFIEELRLAVKAENPEAAVLGEVWEDATNKLSYGRLRSYALGRGLDSVMNYPLRSALIGWFLFETDAFELCRRILSLKENYPPQMFYALMNLIGSHDKGRIITILGGGPGAECGVEEPAELALTKGEYERGKRAVMAMFAFVCALPGMPAIYYGDEAGMQGGPDPYCRGPYPWGREDQEMVESFKASIAKRQENPVWARGEMDVLAYSKDVLIIRRWMQSGQDAPRAGAKDARAYFMLSRAKEAVLVDFEGKACTLEPLAPIWSMGE